MLSGPENPHLYERYRTETIRDPVYFKHGGIVMQKQKTDFGTTRRIKWTDIMRNHFPPSIEMQPSAFLCKERNDTDIRRSFDRSEPDGSIGHS